MTLPIADGLADSVGDDPERRQWLSSLPGRVETLAARWQLAIESVVVEDVTCSWVAICRREGGGDAVLKLGMPHMEARDELAGMRVWDGDGVARVYAADAGHNALLLERCRPGTTLRARPEVEQDEVIAAALRRLWRPPPHRSAFRSLGAMMNLWCEDVRAGTERLADPGLAARGLQHLDRLLATTSDRRLLVTDLHAGNVLAAEREPWLVIDPKPFVGDPAFDATQHLLNCDARTQANPLALTERLARLLAVDRQRVRGWLFVRLATTQRSAAWVETAHRLAAALDAV